MNIVYYIYIGGLYVQSLNFSLPKYTFSSINKRNTKDIFMSNKEEVIP